MEKQPNRFDVISTPLEGLKILRRKPLGDLRGYFERVFCSNDLGDFLNGKAIVQINHTLTARRGILRGMHYQRPPFAEIKLISCVRGRVFDVAVDVRKNSPTFLHSFSQELTPDNHKSMLIPEGFAHGFQSLEDDCELLYLHTAPFEASAEAALNPLDSLLNISWPIAVTDMSDRDRNHAVIRQDFRGVEV